MKIQNRKIIAFISFILIIIVIGLHVFSKYTKAENKHRIILSQYNYSPDAYQLYDGAIDGEYASGKDDARIDERYVYAPSVNDITEYLGTDSVSSKDLMRMFFDIESGNTSEWIWLRSACSSGTYYSAGVIDPDACLNYDSGYDTGIKNSARAIFSIDLSRLNNVECSNIIPVKGDIIALDLNGDGNPRIKDGNGKFDEAFRVLSFNGKVAKVLSMRSIKDVPFNSKADLYITNVPVPISVSPSGKMSRALLKYKNSILDTTLNSTYFNNISTNTNIKNAIQKTINLVQDNFYWMKKNTVPFNTYDITSPDSPYIQTSGTTFDFKSKGSYDKFVKIQTNHIDISPDHYTLSKASDGTTIITPKVSSIESIASISKEYTIKLVFTDGYSELKVKVVSLNDYKNEAKEALEEEAKNKPHYAAVQKTLDEAKKEVEKATTKSKVDDAKIAGIEAIRTLRVGILYKLVKQDDTYICGSKKIMLFESEANYSKFTHIVKIDGREITENKDYISRSGSTIIELQIDYLEKLALGNHVLEINSDDGYALAKFKVVGSNKDDIKPIKPIKDTKNITADAPETADNTNVLFVTIAMFSVLSLAIVRFTTSNR